MSLESMEKLMIREALRRHKGNRTKAARQLGINPSTLFRKMKVLDISANDENS
jgi:transcriptional regulator with PAS, ATPase and Fis domain